MFVSERFGAAADEGPQWDAVSSRLAMRASRVYLAVVNGDFNLLLHLLLLQFRHRPD
jgi:hypothetical protein